MQIKPNKTILRGRVNRVERSPDGWGANVEFLVESSIPAAGYPDFVQAQPGATLTIFSADPDTVRPGQKYSLTTSVLGGPGGERLVMEVAKAKG